MLISERGKNGNGPRTICWDCQNAYGGCSWSKSFRPVDGWNATRRDVLVSGDKAYAHKEESYIVHSCPEFQQDEPRPENHRPPSPDFERAAETIKKRLNAAVPFCLPDYMGGASACAACQYAVTHFWMSKDDTWDVTALIGLSASARQHLYHIVKDLSPSNKVNIVSSGGRIYLMK